MELSIAFSESRLLKSSLICKEVGGTNVFPLKMLLLYNSYVGKKKDGT